MFIIINKTISVKTRYSKFSRNLCGKIDEVQIKLIRIIALVKLSIPTVIE